MTELEKTESICPTCLQQGTIQKIPASIIQDNKKIWIIKHCQHHGSFKEIYCTDVSFYKRWMKYRVTGKPNLQITTQLSEHPALYQTHHSQTILTNLVVTNRCNLQCAYCYANAGATDYVYEPSLDQLKKLMQQARTQKPIGSTSIQITGGEPTLRDDLFDIIQLAKDVGFTHIQLHTNGLRLAQQENYCSLLKKAHLNSVHLSFNGVTEQTNPLLKEHHKAVENLRKENLNVVLTPLLIGGKNIHETGKILRFALDNIDIVRGVHFQPITFCGRAANITGKERQQQRVEYIQLLQAIEKEFPGLISREDFYPFSSNFPISQFVETYTKESCLMHSSHPFCGGSTYLFIKDGKILPLPRFYDVNAFNDFIEKQTKKKGPFRKLRAFTALVTRIRSFVDETKSPEGFDVMKIAKDAAIGGSQHAFRDYSRNSLFVGFMGHQDPWTLSIDRLQRCLIHYSTVEGMIPFCSYVALGYGDKIQRKNSISLAEWKKKTSRLPKDDQG